jgi:hypothetical protein
MKYEFTVDIDWKPRIFYIKCWKHWRLIVELLILSKMSIGFEYSFLQIQYLQQSIYSLVLEKKNFKIHVLCGVANIFTKSLKNFLR